jgi:hypothetical protein
VPIIFALILLTGVSAGGAVAVDKATIHHYHTPPTTRAPITHGLIAHGHRL